MKKILNWVMAATLVCGASVLTACKEAHAQEDNPVQQVTSRRAGTAWNCPTIFRGAQNWWP